jgi:hypothetical protein
MRRIRYRRKSASSRWKQDLQTQSLPGSNLSRIIDFQSKTGQGRLWTGTQGLGSQRVTLWAASCSLAGLIFRCENKNAEQKLAI